jgi:cell division septal protein FtsQ
MAHRPQQLLIRIALSGVALLLLSRCWSGFVSYAVHHPYFALQEIIIDDNAGFTQEEILAWSGLAPGMSLWEIDPKQTEHRLLARAWIQTAQVRRDFPQRVHIAVGARRPVAVVLEPELTYLDETGTCFPWPQPQPAFDLPYVSGFATVQLDTPLARTALAGVLHLLSLARLLHESISEIHWDVQQGYTLFLEQRRVAIRFGWEIAPEKFAQVGTVLTDWPTNAPAAIFDARFTDQIVVRPYVDEGNSRGRTVSRPL